MGTLISSNALADSERRVLFLKRRYGLDIRSGLNGMRISWAVQETPCIGRIHQTTTGRLGRQGIYFAVRHARSPSARSTSSTRCPTECASRGRCPWVSNPGAGLLGVGRVDTVRGVRPSP